MIRRIDGETGLPLHAARKIKEKFEKLRKEKEDIENRLTALEKQHEIIDHQTIKDSLATISDAILQLDQRVTKIEEFLKEEFGYE